MADYTFDTIKQGLSSLIAASKSMRSTYSKITVITLAMIVSSDEDRESVGMKHVSEDALRKFFYNKLNLDSKSSEARSVRNAISRAVSFKDHVDLSALSGLNSFGAICNHLVAQIVRIEALRALADQAKRETKTAEREQEKAALKVEVERVQHAEHTAKDIESRFTVESEAENDTERLAAIFANMRELSDENLAILAAGLNAHLRERSAVSQAIAMAA